MTTLNQPPTDRQIIKRLCRNKKINQDLIQLDKMIKPSLKKRGWRLALTGNHETLAGDLKKIQPLLSQKQLEKQNFKKIHLNDLNWNKKGVMTSI